MPPRISTSFLFLLVSFLASAFTVSAIGGGAVGRLGAAADGYRRSLVSSKGERQMMDSCAVKFLNEDFLECLGKNDFFVDGCGGALFDKTDSWCDLGDGAGEVCCGDEFECCELSKGGIAVGVIVLIAIVLILIIASCACCRYVIEELTNNNNAWARKGSRMHIPPFIGAHTTTTFFSFSQPWMIQLLPTLQPSLLCQLLWWR